MAQASMVVRVLFLVALSPMADAVNIRGAAPKGRQQIAPNNVPYNRRCPMKRTALLNKAASVKLNNSVMMKVPGTGMSPEGIKAEFAAGKVYKDGFYNMGCIKDYMYYKGDKFGDNKYDYELEEIANVSIVFPLSYVAKEDQTPMTVTYCYNMCRQLENINFFGIVNGRDCYCTPYVKPMAGDDSVCDAVCDGDKGVICGSKTKSSVFQMHSCDDASAQLSSALSLFEDLHGGVANWTNQIDSTPLDARIDAIKAAFGAVGDPEASNLFQASESIVSAINEIHRKATAMEAVMRKTVAEAKSVENADFGRAEVADKADNVMATMATQTTEANNVLAYIHEYGAKVYPTMGSPLLAGNASGASKQYYPLMYFIDKKFEKAPTTCSGELMAIYFGVSVDQCAKLCDGTDVEGCMGFSYVPAKPNSVGSQAYPVDFCFTFSKITGAQYYTKDGCEASAVMCYGKFSKLSGSSPLDKEKGQKAIEADSRCMPLTDTLG